MLKIEVLLISSLAIILGWLASQAEAGVAFGLTGGNQTVGATLGDYNLFEQDRTYWGVKRYGGGVSRIQAGTGVGVSLQSSGGFLLNDDDNAVGPRLGLEAGAGHLIANTNRGVESSYQWLPMMSAGPQVSVFGSKLLFVGRAGGSAGNYGNKGWAPRVHNAFGYGIYLDDHAAFTYTAIGGAHQAAWEIEDDAFLMRYEDNRGDRDEKSLLFMYRWDMNGMTPVGRKAPNERP